MLWMWVVEVRSEDPEPVRLMKISEERQNPASRRAYSGHAPINDGNLRSR